MSFRRMVCRVAAAHLARSEDLDIQKHLDKFGLDWTFDPRTQSYHVNGGASHGGFTFTQSDSGWVFQGARSGGDVMETSYDVWKTITHRMASVRVSTRALKSQVWDLLNELETEVEEEESLSRSLRNRIEDLMSQVDADLTGDPLSDLTLSALYNALDYMDSVFVWSKQKRPRDVQQALVNAERELRSIR